MCFYQGHNKKEQFEFFHGDRLDRPLKKFISLKCVLENDLKQNGFV